MPITGNRQKRILHGVLNVTSGDALLLITREWVAETHQAFLRMIRSHWRGWRVVLFEDRGTPHTAEESREVARSLGIEVRLVAARDAGTQRDGSPVAAGQRAGSGEPPDALDR